MDILKLITGNASIKNMMLEKFKEMAKEEGSTKFILETEPELKIIPVKENEVLTTIQEQTFLKNFFNQNKNLKDAKF